jgi:hypothetical protein
MWSTLSDKSEFPEKSKLHYDFHRSNTFHIAVSLSILSFNGCHEKFESSWRTIQFAVQQLHKHLPLFFDSLNASNGDQMSYDHENDNAVTRAAAAEIRRCGDVA